MSRSGARYGVPGSALNLVLAPGYYYWVPRGVSVSTTATLTNNRLRTMPFTLQRGTVLDRIGGEVTAIGDAGSVLRLGLYRDNGADYPGALVLDAGTIAADAVAIAEIVIAQSLPAFGYWMAGVLQGAPVVQPTIRTVAQTTNATRGLAAVTGGGTAGGYFTDGVSGALPDPFPAGAATHGTQPQTLLRASS